MTQHDQSMLLRRASLIEEAQALARIGSWEVDMAAGLVCWTRWLYEVFATPADFAPTLEGMRRLVTPESAARIQSEFLRNRATGDGFSLHLDCLTADGRPFRGRLTARLEATSGGTTRVYGIFQDVTEQERLATHVARALRVESLGMIASCVAHDFNNVLTVIGNYQSVLRRMLPAEGEMGAYLRRIGDAAKSGAAVTRRLLEFVRGSNPALQVRDLNVVVAEVADMLARFAGDGVTVSLELEAAELLVCIDAAEIEQLLVNLVTNARDAMAGTGRITIAVRRAETHVELLVSDTGPGVPQEIAPRIFDPFFSTKTSGDGSGLGLATASAIARRNGGQLMLDASAGGAVFRVLLPSRTAAGTTDEAADVRSASRGS